MSQLFSALGVHDYLAVIMLTVLGLVFWRTLLARSRDSASKIDLDDLFLDHSIGKMSWPKFIATVVIGFICVVLLQRSIGGYEIDTLASALLAAVVAPLITRILKGAENVQSHDDPTN